jgi:predicted nucleic acid-binding protein
MKIILDTSAALHVALQGEHAAELAQVIEQATQVLCPQLVRAELGHALRKYMRGQQLPLDQALQHWEDATGLIDELLDDTTLMLQAKSLAARYEHTVYDALYIAAALQQGARLLTLDKKLKALASQIDPQMVADFA